MKKTTKFFGIAALVAAFSTISAGGAFAQAFSQLPLSFGISTSLISDFGGGVSGSVTEAGTSAAENWLGNEVYWHGSYAGFASSIFLDAHFVQLSFGYFTSTGSSRTRIGNSTTIFDHGLGTPSPTGIEIGLLGKFPVELSPRITVFPLAGIAYRIILTGGASVLVIEYRALEFDPLDSSALWFRLGGGMDFSINENVFLRTAVSYGVRLRTRWENDVINNGPHWVSGAASPTPADPEAGNHRFVTYDNARLGHGVDVTIGIGFRLR
ncbi:MAG: hypothetical protein FWG66_00480 [Spirochaetes bacterium]|nr:hypothetical protein [Spirochaetota bacterium]